MTDQPTPTIRPALTTEEWGKYTERGRFRSLDHTIDDPNELYATATKDGRLVLPDAHFEWAAVGRARHALAALALHGQPFGFTRADLVALGWMMRYDADPDDVAQCRSLAARIEALLPP